MKCKIYILPVLLIPFFSCEKNILPEEDENIPVSYLQSDDEGNLTIINQTNTDLLLSIDDQKTGTIGKDQKEVKLQFWPGYGVPVQLKVWKINKNSETVNIISDKPYQQTVIGYQDEDKYFDHYCWIISEDEVKSETGMLELFMGEPSDNEFHFDNVEIYLNSDKGSKLATLTQNQRVLVNIAYGTHIFFLRYLTDGYEAGWNRTIYYAVNAQHHSLQVEIPPEPFNEKSSGILKVLNQTDNAINVFSGNNLIELLALNIPGTGISSVPSKDSSCFYLNPGTYHFDFRSITGNPVLSLDDIYLTDSSEVRLQPGIPYRKKEIRNNTNETLLVYDRQNFYLGYKIESNSTKTICIPENLQLIHFKTPTGKQVTKDIRQTIDIGCEINNPLVETFVSQASVFTANITGIAKSEVPQELSTGHCFSAVNPEPTLDDRYTLNSGTTNEYFESCLENLEPATTYYVRSFVVTNCETVYGDVKTFRTKTNEVDYRVKKSFNLIGTAYWQNIRGDCDVDLDGDDIVPVHFSVNITTSEKEAVATIDYYLEEDGGDHTTFQGTYSFTIYTAAKDEGIIGVTGDRSYSFSIGVRGKNHNYIPFPSDCSFIDNGYFRVDGSGGDCNTIGVTGTINCIVQTKQVFESRY